MGGLVERASHADTEPGDVRFRFQRSPAFNLAAASLTVAVLVLGVHWPALSARALPMDDEKHVTRNPLVQSPSWRSVWRFFGDVLEPASRGYYRPLAMTSVMVDRAFAAGPDDLRAFRRTSLALHVANTVLVIVLLYALFGNVWAAGLTGLLYGVHPLTVESIPWAEERKTLLAAGFSLLCLILYIRYTRAGRWYYYAASLLAYALALLSKPTSVPLAVLLIVLDYWPLRRLRWGLLVEKVPFLALACAGGVVAFVSQQRTSLLELPEASSVGLLELLLRVSHNVVFYIYKTVWPARLSVFYPVPHPFDLSQVAVLVGVVGTAFLFVMLLLSWVRTRALVSGWLFFFIAAFPTMGVIGFTNVIAADRFVYFPLVGLLLPVAWYLGRVWDTRKGGYRRVYHGAIVAVVAILASAEGAATRAYLRDWRESVTLYTRMVRLAPHAPEPHNYLGLALAARGDFEEAATQYRAALRLQPAYAEAHNSLGHALLELGKVAEAAGCFEAALRLRSESAEAHNNLGLCLARMDRAADAMECYRRALELDPEYAPAYNNLGNALARQGSVDEAIRHYQAALRSDPGYATAWNNWGNALRLRGRTEEAITCYREALRLQPDYVMAHYNLAVALDDAGRTAEAVGEYQRVLALDPRHAAAAQRLRTLRPR